MAKGKQGKGRVQKVITIVKAKGEPDEVSVERSEGKPGLKPVPEPKLEPEPVTVAIAPPQPVPASLPIPLSKGIRITPKRPRIRR